MQVTHPTPGWGRAVTMKFDFLALREEWKRAGRPMRYFLASHVLANLLMATISLASMIYGAMGRSDMQMLLLGVAVLCGGQALLAWNVLQKRFRIRYSLW
jgi:hypothetical protein